MIFVFAVLAVTIGLMLWEKLSLDIVAMLAFSALLAAGILTPAEAFKVFSNEAAITVASMFILSGALERTGVTSRELLRAYYACTSFVDAQIGRVLAELDALGLRENIIMVVWGDHGWHLGEYGIWGKATNYEVATRVPLIVSAPKVAAAGQGTRVLVESVDVYPSLCELAGLPLPKHLEGKRFVPLLNNPDQPWKQAAFSQFPSPALRQWAARPLSPAMRGTFFGPVIADVEAKLKQEHGDRYDAELFDHHVMGYSMRTERYRYTAWLDRRAPGSEPLAEELYDHRTDPHGRVNIAKGSPAIVKTLSAQLRAQFK
jgi:iduronate 2-sulfatase